IGQDREARVHRPPERVADRRLVHLPAERCHERVHRALAAVADRQLVRLGAALAPPLGDRVRHLAGGHRSLDAVPGYQDHVGVIDDTAGQATADTYLLTEEQVEFRDLVRQIAQERVAPRAAEIDEKAEYPHDLRKLLSDQDILGLPFDTEHGGTGTGTLT